MEPKQASYQLFSSTGFDLSLTTLSWNNDHEGPSPFLLLPYHFDRLTSAARTHRWDHTILTYDYLKSTCLDAVSKEQQHLPTSAFRIRITLSQDGQVKVTVTPLPTSFTSDPTILPFDKPSSIDQDANCMKIYVDTEPITPSLFTTTKTTLRDIYNNARTRNQKRLQPGSDWSGSDIILWNDEGFIMEATIFNVAFYRSSKWITPSTNSGCLPGVIRRWLLHRNRIFEDESGTLTKDSIQPGEWVLVFNGVQGCRLAWKLETAELGMSNVIGLELRFVALCLEGFLFGLYSGIFVMYLQHYKRQETSNKITFYPLCTLYVLSAVVFSMDFSICMGYRSGDLVLQYRALSCQSVAFACCDVICQSIMIYRCWLVWARNIRVVIVPSILAFAFFVMWIADTPSISLLPGGVDEAMWGVNLILAALTASMVTNAMVTVLIVSKIFKVFRDDVTTSQDQHLRDITAGSKLRSILFVIIESAMALFIIQLARLIMAIAMNSALRTVSNGDTLFGIYIILLSIHDMLNGITPTIILVRVSMGFSFHDQQTLAVNVGSLQFAANDPNPIPGMRSIDSRNRHESLHSGPDEPIPMSSISGSESRDEDTDYQ